MPMKVFDDKTLTLADAGLGAAPFAPPSVSLPRSALASPGPAAAPRRADPPPPFLRCAAGGQTLLVLRPRDA